MPESDLALLIRAATEAGQIARRFWAGDNRVWDKSTDDPVSEADLAVDRALRDLLGRARPDYGWLSEESEDTEDRLRAGRLFIVDPIDGTRAFVAGRKTWAHSLAVVEDGRTIAGVVFLPLRDRLYAAALGKGATLNGAPVAVAGDLADTTGPMRLLANGAAMADRYWPGGVPDADRAFRPSLAYRICLVAQGRFDAMITFRDSWEWDIAAGSLIAAEAGARVTDRAGQPLVFNNPRPATPGIIAAAPAAWDRIAAHRRAP